MHCNFSFSLLGGYTVYTQVMGMADSNKGGTFLPRVYAQGWVCPLGAMAVV